MKLFSIQKFAVVVLILSSVIGMTSCDGGDPTRQGGDSTYASTATVDTTLPEQPQMATVSIDTVGTTGVTFLHQAATSAQMMVNVAQIALKDAASNEVKNLAKTVSDKNSQLINKLQDLAKAKNMDFPLGVSAALQDEMDEMTKKQGTDFDQSFVHWVIEESQRDIEDFEKAIRGLDDEEFKQYASIAVPILVQQKDAAVSLKDNF